MRGMASNEHLRRQALRRLEEALQQIPVVDRSPVACEPGCSFCCHLRVMALPVEVFGLVDFVKARFTPGELSGFRERLVMTAAQIRAVPAGQLLAANIPCPLLVDGRCSAYAARPLNCRSYHSLDRAACERSFNEPANPAHTHPQFSKVARVHESVQAGLVSATSAAGYDARQYELVTALEEAMGDAAARRRFEDKQPGVFRRTVEVIL